MANILSINTDVSGQIGINPRIVKIISSDFYSVITQPGYLNQTALEGFTLYPTDMILMSYNNLHSTSPVTGLFTIVIKDGIIILQPFLYSNLVYEDILLESSSLSLNKKVIVVKCYNKQTFIIREIFINLSLSPFSGGGGNRDIILTDGSEIFTTIPSASLTTSSNQRWGSVSVPFPNSFPVANNSVPGNDIYAQYSGGTTDYSFGSAYLTVLYQSVG